ncbi:hypothetical protein [Streptomyces sp. PT12]|uniref:hypothetical protein n=1 Tax=Streptomyces sp. PT12 TaxID=1510197 RepID=UPI000DE20052|nr:hypothetical protein [Streptomyces sp. PT12]RBM23251.1 hypothetical protein DEH69_02675 [Streptomyces sp. PT12]
MSENTTEEPGAPAGERPRAVTVAAVLCGVQGAVAAAFGGVMLLLAVAGDPGDRTQALTGAVTVLVLAALPLAAGHGLWRLRRWSRAPGVVVQLFSLPIAFTLVGSGGLWPLAGAGLALSAVAALGCLVNPKATRALGVGPRPAGPTA